MRLNWSLPRIHTIKLIDCKYTNTYFNLLVDIDKFCSNIKGLEIVGQIANNRINYQNQINAWKKCSHVEHDVSSHLLKMYKVFCLKELSGAIIRGVMVRGVIIRGAIVLEPFQMLVSVKYKKIRSPSISLLWMLKILSLAIAWPCVRSIRNNEDVLQIGVLKISQYSQENNCDGVSF